MIVVVDTSTFDTIRFHLITPEGNKDVAFQMRNKELLHAFDQMLQDEGIALEDIEAIGVLMSAGSFTGTRLAVTFANTMLYAKQIPVVSVQSQDIPPYETLRANKKQTYLHAEYSGEPNINI